MMMSGKKHSPDSRIDLAQVRPQRILDKTGKCRLCTSYLKGTEMYSLKKTDLGWNFRTIYRGQEPRRNRVDVPACRAAEADKIDSLESIPRLLKSLKIPPLI
jgi:hypothetical protein